MPIEAGIPCLKRHQKMMYQMPTKLLAYEFLIPSPPSQPAKQVISRSKCETNPCACSLPGVVFACSRTAGGLFGSWGLQIPWVELQRIGAVRFPAHMHCRMCFLHLRMLIRTA
jgi:hypothetical protein